MMDEKAIQEEQADAMLQQLLHLKSYEKPEASRMTRNKQNIMRQVRQSQSEKRKPLLDILELNIPWFFAEPKYGIAALFVAFVGLQYAGITAKHSSTDTGIYTSTDHMAAYELDANTSAVQSNRYPNLPSNYKLFGNPEGDSTVLPASFQLNK